MATGIDASVAAAINGPHENQSPPLSAPTTPLVKSLLRSPLTKTME